MRLILSLLLLMMLTRVAAEVPANLDAYMFVDGQVTVSEVGRVLDHRIETEVDPQVAALIDSVVGRWLFEPVKVAGEAVPFTSDVLFTLHGLTTDIKGQLMVRVEDVVFTGSRRDGIEGAQPEPAVSYRKIIRPSYPSGQNFRGVQGKTVIALRIGRDGKVIDKAVSYTDLVGTSTSEAALADARKAFEKAALRVVGHWTFDVRADAFEAGTDDLTVLLPISYALTGSERRWSTPGRWTILTRGPRQRIAWLDDGELAANFAEGASAASRPVKLMTQPDGSPL